MIGPKKVKEVLAEANTAIKSAVALSIVALVVSVIALAVAVLGGKLNA